MTFKLNSFQQEVFNAIREFNRSASFEYVEWLKQKHFSSVTTASTVEETAKLVEKPEQPFVQEFQAQATIPDQVYSKKVKIRMMRNGRNISMPDEVAFLIVDLEDQHLAQQIDEVTCSWVSSTRCWNTAIVTRANGKAVTIVKTVPQFLNRANPRRKRQHGIAQTQPFNFSKAVY